MTACDDKVETDIPTETDLITESEVELKYKEGTVTIELKYPDAEEISESYFDIEFDEYLDEIREVKPNKTKKITIDFVLKDDDWLVTKKSDKKFKETLESLVANIELEPYNGGGSSDPVPDPGVVADPLAENKIGILFTMDISDCLRQDRPDRRTGFQLGAVGHTGMPLQQPVCIFQCRSGIFGTQEQADLIIDGFQIVSESAARFSRFVRFAFKVLVFDQLIYIPVNGNAALFHPVQNGAFVQITEFSANRDP